MRGAPKPLHFLLAAGTALAFLSPAQAQLNRFRIVLSPDSVLSGTPFTISAAYINSQGDTVRQDRDAFVFAVLNGDSTQRGSGRLDLIQNPGDTLIHLKDGVVAKSVTYAVQRREVIWIHLRDTTLRASGISGNSILVIPILQAGELVVNYPNPFGYNQPTTTIRYLLSHDANVNLTIYDLFGNPVWHREFSSGNEGGRGGVEPNAVIWDGKNEKGQEVGSGAYVLRLVATTSAETIANYTRKIAVVR